MFVISVSKLGIVKSVNFYLMFSLIWVKCFWKLKNIKWNCNLLIIYISEELESVHENNEVSSLEKYDPYLIIIFMFPTWIYKFLYTEYFWDVISFSLSYLLDIEEGICKYF